MYYDKLEIENTIGTILVKDSRVILDGVKHEHAGRFHASYRENTIPGMSKILWLISILRLQPLIFLRHFQLHDTLQQFAPIAGKAVGKVSLGMKYSSYLDAHMMPLLKSVVGKGNFTSECDWTEKFCYL